MHGLIQTTDKHALLKNQNTLDYRYTRLYNKVCLLQSLIEDGGGDAETDPIFSASDAASITSVDINNWYDAVTLSHEHLNKGVLDGISSTLVSNWNDAFSWGNHASAGYVPIAGTTTITGAKTFSAATAFNANITLGGNLLFDGDLTRSIGAVGGRPFIIYGVNLLKGAAGSGFNFAVTSTTTDIFARFHPTTHEFVLQAPGSAPTNTGQRLQVIGTSLLNGNVTFGGNLLPDGDGTRSLGTAALRTILFTTTINKGSAGVSLSASVTGSTDVFARFFATTHNLILQAAGTAGTDDTISRLQVIGKIRVTDIPTYADNAAAITGGLIVGNFYKLADGSLKIVI